MSLHDWPLFGDNQFSGAHNYQRMLTDDTFLASVAFTAKYTFLVTAITVAVGFSLALLVHPAMRGVALFRTAYFIPVVTGTAAASYLWVWMFNDQVGIVNSTLLWLHLIEQPVQWLAEPGTALVAYLVMTLWKTVGFSMVIFLIGMQAIPEEVLQAAKVDGAGALASLRRIAIPMLRRSFALVIVLTVISAALAFDQFYVMTRGGPRNSMVTIVYWIYSNAFTYFKLGYAAALSIVLLTLLALVSILQLRLLRGDEE